MQDGEVVEQVALDPSGAGWVQHQARRFRASEFCGVPAEVRRFHHFFASNSYLLQKCGARRDVCVSYSPFSPMFVTMAVVTCGGGCGHVADVGIDKDTHADDE